MTISASVTNFQPSAFERCGSLTNVTFENGLPMIGSNAFQACAQLASVTIPGSVTNIGQNAFNGCTGMTNATMAEGVASIGSDAFYDCSSLVSVTMPDSVTSIGAGAFSLCGSLTNVNIPSGVTNIGAGPFSECVNLSTITVDTNNASFSSTDGVLFDKAQATLIQYPGGAPGVYVIPGTVVSIADSAFQYCTNLTNVTIPVGVASIGNYSFEYLFWLDQHHRSQWRQQYGPVCLRLLHGVDERYFARPSRRDPGGCVL